VARLRGLLEDVSGIDFAAADPRTPFVELGLDSLLLTQAALQMRGTFGVAVTFREIMERHRSLDALAQHLDAAMPPEATRAAPVARTGSANPAPARPPSVPIAPMPGAAASVPRSATATGPIDSSGLQRLVAQQLELMRRQLELLQGGATAHAAARAPEHEATTRSAAAHVSIEAAGAQDPTPPAVGSADDEDAAPGRYDVKKAFGAIARIHTRSTDALSPPQRARLDAFVRRYTARTPRSKAYTATHRPHLADPRVVNGFRPLLKEIVYQLVIERSAGARVWDIDGNEYVDALNGFGMNLFGWRPAFVDEAVRAQLEAGYEIGPQHPLAGEVARRVCELTGFDRAAMCNTGSEAVMGCVRIARTVTGRSRMVIFSGSYHGIFDEVIVRGTRTLKSIPAAPGILPNTSENVVVLDYGTPESMGWLREHAHELAAVLVEPVQSRRPDFQPREFLRELRELTSSSGTLLVFDEIVTGFRSHPGGIQALFGIRADLASYGKVVGGGFPIGIIAGRREFMDALDGGHWEFGDDSMPTVGVTYFAGTFVRHPLALAAANAVLERIGREGPELQASLTRSTAAMVDELNAFCRQEGAPITLKSFASLWKVVFDEDHPLQDLLFAMMRDRGVHVLDNFPCFMTTAHSAQDIAVIKTAFKEAVAELQAAEFLPRRPGAPAGFDAQRPPVPGARLGRDPEGRPAWFVANPDVPGKYIKLEIR
jgi:glutamate-1-semialdehyde aminotransferase